ncbi:MAG: hypothetical protein HY904_00430 [Deltaproteobacteria bacterium]|nr:hypothetical protein [Deltaproteobacteria bacterium]
MCTAGTCAAPSCPTGDTGCACRNGETCTASSDTCVSGFCQPTACAPGEADCACLAGTCLPGLACVAERCVENRGYLGGACLPDGTCHRGFRCDDTASCTQCLLGTQDCACAGTGACEGSLVCTAGQCRPPTGDPAPDSPACFTPCERDLVAADGTFRACAADGLMPGCVDSLECVQGTCTTPDGGPRTCSADLDCPSFQACLQGNCFSNCDVDGDCAPGKVCDLRVCRPSCVINGPPCPEGTSCISDDGEHGTCRPMGAAGDEPQTSVDGIYTLSETFLRFSNVATTLKITLTNNSPTFQTFTLHKRSHDAFFSDATSESLDDPADDAVTCNPATNCPLTWLSMGEEGAAAQVQSVAVGVEGNGGTATLELSGAAGTAAVRWNGIIELRSPRLPTRTLLLEYSERPEGRWAGNIYYFAQFGDRNLEEWRATPASRDDPAKLNQVGNAFLKRWGAFRSGNLSWDEFMAVLTSTKDETWRWASVKRDCPESPRGACYLYTGSTLGLTAYSTDLVSTPIPTGVVDLPFAANLHQPDATAAPKAFRGRIESSQALQYAGQPAFALDFGADPSTCQRQVGGACVVFVDALSADVLVGGRYTTTTGTCDQQGYTGQSVPWLLPGFVRATDVDPADGVRKRSECRDTWLPFDDGSAVLPEPLAAANRSLAASNPIPDGRTRKRTLRLVDGALINQSLLFLIFEERFESFLPNDNGTFSAYGYMLLERQATDLDMADDNGNAVPDAYEGSQPVDTRTDQPGRLGVTCSPDLLDRALDYSDENNTVTSANVFELVHTLLTGISSHATSEPITDLTPDEAVHYLCVDTRMFDGGRYDRPDPTLVVSNNRFCGTTGTSPFADNGVCDDGGPGSSTSVCPLGTDRGDCAARTAADANVRVPCPAESEVVYFTVDPARLSQADVAAATCQVPAQGATVGSCSTAQITTWQSEGKVRQLAPFWRCANGKEQYCDRDRLDLRQGKTFFKAAIGGDQPVFNSLYTDINQAFRYRTRFVSRTGATIGFAPQLCIPGSNQVPYCYDPAMIESVRARIECLLQVWRDFHEDPALLQTVVTDPGDPAAVPPVPPTLVTGRELLDDYLCASFAYTEGCHPEMDPTQVHDGFERLYAELLVMMGDESYTRSFASRFDLAGTGASSFLGASFEKGGINLSGPAGYEMFNLYQAAQYYQEALDRFYSLSPLVWDALQYGFTGRNFVTQETVTRYLERLVRASTQKARTWSQVAQRYQNFNRPDLARSVVERAYTATYLESIALGQLMQRITKVMAPEDQPQIAMELENGQRRYRMAMLDMRNVYKAISDDINYFGFPPDYIPFPTMGEQTDVSAFEVILARAKAKLADAKDRENDALARSRAFETDAQEFQAELVKLRNNYENQLGEVCGTFQGDDGRVYPAVSSYADMNEATRRVGDPCGRVGTGAIAQAMGQFEISRVDLERTRASFDNVLAEVAIEHSRVEAQCNLIFDLADYTYTMGALRLSLETTVRAAKVGISAIERIVGYTATLSGMAKCIVIAGPGGGGSDCPAAVGSVTAYSLVYATGAIGIVAIEAAIAAAETEIGVLDLTRARWETQHQCDVAMVDANARMATLVLRLKELQLEALRGEYQVRLAAADITAKHNLALRLEQELKEAEQFSININAAKNDPNVRIYRNDAYLNADLSFKNALQEAYRATKVLEYYTSQSYAPLEQLFLIRMVQYGDYNLSNYLADLENEFYRFEEDYGLPDTRAMILSLRDDIMRIPVLDDAGLAIPQGGRIDMMRARLADASLLDENGYLTIPFSTNFERLSPLTRDHKILYVEAEVIGSGVGDSLGRLYLRQQGTSAVHGVTGETLYYRFPERLAVLNPFFNGTRFFTPAVYRNNRFRDRPFVNTAWELAINQKDERENQDIDLQSLSDVRLFIYYTDFTQF